MTGAEPHRYVATCSWRGSTAQGYEHYDRRHTAVVPAAGATITLSSDSAFRGDPALLNPEQLLVLAAASCQLLSFLAVASRARLDVLAYDDTAEGVMPDEPRTSVTEIVLRPRIAVAAGVDAERVTHLCDVAHRECFIANSLRTEIRIEPTIVRG
ncbi:MAG: OsmC family protein [Actinobacteria bacterium]|nr:OsmC family protein [Actinomycetota bacterium]